MLSHFGLVLFYFFKKTYIKYFLKYPFVEKKFLKF